MAKQVGTLSELIPGIHHITAIASDPAANVRFYRDFLGLRLVKKTVNFDDPGTYHLYYGDDAGHPGTILTFFPWPGAARGRLGTGEVSVVQFEIPKASLGYYTQRCREVGIPSDGPESRFTGEQFLTIFDPDGMMIELVEGSVGADGEPPRILGFHGATISLEGYEATAKLLTEAFGFRLTGEHGNRFRYEATEGGLGSKVDLLCIPDARRGSMGAGTVHHIAWRTADDKTQLEWRKRLADLGYNVTPVMDRQYFHSIYFRERGGVLFEIATDPPGFAIDEAPAELGTHLKLPPWMEPKRRVIEQILPPLE